MGMSRTSALTLSAVILGLGAVGGAILFEHTGQPRHHEIQSSYVFDVEDPELIAGYADAIVVGEVVSGKTHDDQGSPTTLFQIKVVEVLKGNASGTIPVRQSGGTIGVDTWEDADQPLLKVGSTYVLAISWEQWREWTLIGGPVAATKLDRDGVVDSWRGHVSKQRDPGLPPH